MSLDISVLNEAQKAPVLDTEGALLVTAGAGSGKTRVLTHRIANLVLNKGVSPYNILAITFTNKASREMKERLNSMLGEECRVWVSTFHAMCVVILRRFSDKIGYTKDFSIYAEDDKLRVIKKIIKESGKDYPDDFPKKTLYAISSAKSDGLTPEKYLKEYEYDEDCEDVYSIYSLYEKALKENNAFDFDDLLSKAHSLLTTVAEVRGYYQEKFMYIHVDEFQDTNEIQYQLVKILAGKHKNVMAVGDEDQSIYGWRGANINNIYNYIQDFDAKKYKLEQNYRSTKKIINLANKVIDNNSSRMAKTLWTDNDEGDDIQTFIAQSESGEAESVARKLVDIIRAKGYQYSDVAVLLRVNALTRGFEEKFINYGIPYNVTGGFKFYDRKEIKDIMAYLRIAVNNQDTEAIERIINFPKRGIGDASIKQLLNYCSVENKQLYKVIRDIETNEDLAKPLCKKLAPLSAIFARLEKLMDDGFNVYNITVDLIKVLNLKEVYSKDTDENESRKYNIKELINAMREFVTTNPKSSASEYLQTTTLYTDADETQEKSCVNLATIHSVKGLEYKVVFLVGLEDGIFPSSRCMDSESEIEEERRLMYVAITRAEKNLILSFSRQRFLYGQSKVMTPSRFLTEMGYTFSAPEKSYDNYGGYSRDGYSGSYAKSAENRAYSTKNSYYDTHSTTKKQTNSSVSTVSTAVRNNAVDIDKFKEGTVVSHKKFGKGIVVSVSGTEKNCYAEIQFDVVGRLNLSLNYAPLEIIEN